MTPTDADDPQRTEQLSVPDVVTPKKAASEPPTVKDEEVAAVPGSQQTVSFDAASGAHGDAAAMPEAPETLPSIPGYEIEQVLGRGGMGIVYKARHLALKRTVALKMILIGRHAGRRERVRFRAEAEAVARLQHPGIVQIHEIGEQDGHPYCALEYIEGGTLAGRLADGPLPPADAARLVEALARAIHVAHGRNVVHRDLKPGNVMLALDGTPKVTDFGLARQLDDDSGVTQMGTVLGTPSYMAPELASGQAHQAGPAADVYALGAILYECVGGRPPFKGKSMVETLDQVRTQEPAPLTRVRAGVPLDLETICFKCLRKEPEARYGSAAELADELGRFLRGEPILARPAGKTERLWRWCRRNPAVAAASALAIAAVLSAAVLSVWFGLSQQQAAADLRAAMLKTDRALEEAKQSLHEARTQSAIQMLERGQALCVQQEVPQGLYWLVRGLQEIPQDEDALRHVIRANLGQWLPYLYPLRTILSHSKAIAVVAFSPDGKLALTASDDGTVQLWDAATGEPHGDPLMHGGSVQAAVFSPDGSMVLTGSHDQMARLWDVATGKLIGNPLPHEARVRAVAFSPDGKTVLTAGDDRTVRLWQAATGVPLGKPIVHPGKVVKAAFGPDGKTVLIGGDDGTARLWNSATGMPLADPWSHKGEVRAVALSPDGTTALTGSIDRTARLWDTATGRPIGAPLAHHGTIEAVAFSPDGKAVLTGSGDRTARLWDAATGFPIGVPLQHLGRVGTVAFSPDGRIVATGSDDRTARLWEAATGRPIGSALWHEHWILRLAFSSDGKAVITGSVDGTARIWDIATDDTPLITQHAAAVNAVAFLPDGKTLLTGGDDRTTRFWDTATARPIGPPLQHRRQVNSVGVTADGSHFFVGAGDTVRVWEAATGRPLNYTLTHQGTVTAAAFSPDGKSIVTGSNDKTARLWDTATGRPLCPALVHRDRVPSVDFAPDGKTVVSSTWAKTAHLWDAKTGAPFGPPLEHKDVVWAVAYRPDSQVVLTHCWDQSVRQWATATGQPLGTPLQLPRSAWSIVWGHDGKTFMTGGMDFSVRRWDAATGRPIGMAWQHDDGVFGMAVSGDGRFLLTGSDDRTVCRWPLRPPLADAPEQLHEVLAVLTGLEIDDTNGDRMLPPAEWHNRHRKLAGLPRAPWQPASLLLGAADWHTVRAAAAEREGKTFAAGWHLDRLIALEPNAWFWYARRARLHLRAGDTAQAEIDDQRAHGCAAGSELENWYRHQLIDSQVGRRWPTALWYVNHLLAGRPNDGDLLAARAEIHGNLQRKAEAAQDLARAAALGAAPDLLSRLTRDEALAQSAGVIRDWLILAPLPLPAGQRGADAIDVEQLAGEADLHPRAGDHVRAGSRELTWQAHRVGGDGVIDFNALLGKAVNYSAAYAVCYIVADTERTGLKLLIGSDDQAKIYLNGKAIYRYSSPRGCHPDEDTVDDISLRRGTNVLLFKVVNEAGDWKGCARFVERTGLPAKGIQVTSAPN
jgi:WD40 repeat protein